MATLTHIDAEGNARMVDVSDKPATRRRATAAATLVVGREVMAAVRTHRTPKGNVYEAARLAGIMAAKRTVELIPLCHPLALDHVAIDFAPADDRIEIRAEVATRSATGVEMEALTAAAVAGLTLIDMLKALSKTMVLEGVRLLAKSGGRSGDWRRPEEEEAP
ncbi:MAG: cyclic pyranopterin monophosphate synthase MoaC [Acidobacteriota bacterium]